MATSSTTGKKKSAPARVATSASRQTATKAPAKKATAKKAPVKKAPAKKAPAKKAAATRAKTAAAKPAAAKAPAKKKATAKASAGNAPAAKASGAKKPPASPYDAKFLAQQKEALLTERATYLRQADSLQAEADLLVAEREPGDVQFDEESGEGDTLAVERERDLALSAQARQQIAEIDDALGKIQHGGYGVCEVSGKPIPKERLKAIPWARVRVEYKTGGLGHR